jgi:hypothetical protein
MSTLSVATIKSQNTLPPAVQNSSGTEIGTFCRAWVNFNGTGTVAIRASFNVSSITDNNTGNYYVNFTTAMSDVNYAIVTTALQNAAGTAYANATSSANTASQALVLINQAGTSTTLADSANIHVAIFR